MAFIGVIAVVLAAMWIYFRVVGKKPCCAECAEKAKTLA
jgi:hypothetical protein